MRKLIIFSLTIMFCGLILGSQTWASSFSSTAVTFKKAVHFMTPDGSDVVVEPGTYELERQGEELRLVSKEGPAPIAVQAGAAPFPEEVESSVAMAIPIPDEGIYLALAVPGEAGLEAMGSYSGIQTRGRSLLNARQSFNPKYRKRLKSFSKQLTNNPKAPSLKDEWNKLVREGKKRLRSNLPKISMRWWFMSCGRLTWRTLKI